MKLPNDKLHFCTAGIPHSSVGRTSEEGLEHVQRLGLDGMEMEFVHGVRMGEEKAQNMGQIAKKHELVLTAHAPYYVNLNAIEKPKWHASITRIVQTAVRAADAGAYSICFHPGFYLKMDPEKVYKKVKEGMDKVFEKLEGVDIWVRPETTGKPTQFGNLKELIRLSAEYERMMPCVDFSHLHARSGGAWNSLEEFRTVLGMMESGLGRKALDLMHMHLSGIAYSEKGERNHLILEESDMLWRELLGVLKEFKVRGSLTCESPNIEDDALLLKKTFSEL